MADEQLTTHQPSIGDETTSDDEATIVVDPTATANAPIDPKLFGKFGEHLPSPRRRPGESSRTPTLSLSGHEVSPSGSIETALADTTVSVDKSWDGVDFELELLDNIGVSTETLFASA